MTLVVFLLASQTTAADTPEVATPLPNNIVGLNVARLHQERYIWATSDLVNANGGDWGYITVTWTIDDRDVALADYNLQQFLDRCFEFHVQPIVRVATRFDTRRGLWVGPTWDEPAKWRAFFERARWPTERVWIIAGNEPNLGREWNGEVDADGYARYLDHFMKVFADSERFKVVNAPLDISNPTELPRMQDAFEFIEGMRAAVPDIFERLPAWASNPYRVPSGGNHLRYTHRAYEAELEAIGRDMPVLITESHLMETDDDEAIAAYFDAAFRDWMNDPRVVAATPLFWHPDTNRFWMFSLDRNGAIRTTSPTYHRLRQLPRRAGSPAYVPTMANVPRPPRPPAPVAETPADPDESTTAPIEAADELDPEATDQPGGAPAPPERSPAASARPADAEPARARIVGTGTLGANVRLEPSITAAVVANVGDGALVEVLEEREADGRHWRRIRTEDGAEGWVASELLEDMPSISGASRGSSRSG